MLLVYSKHDIRLFIPESGKRSQLISCLQLHGSTQAGGYQPGKKAAFVLILLPCPQNWWAWPNGPCTSVTCLSFESLSAITLFHDLLRGLCHYRWKQQIGSLMFWTQPWSKHYTLCCPRCGRKFTQFVDCKESNFSHGHNDVIVSFQGLAHLHAHQGIQAQVGQGTLSIQTTHVTDTWEKNQHTK